MTIPGLFQFKDGELHTYYLYSDENANNRFVFKKTGNYVFVLAKETGDKLKVMYNDKILYLKVWNEVLQDFTTYPEVYLKPIFLDEKAA